jgi:hypothetical protein
MNVFCSSQLLLLRFFDLKRARYSHRGNYNIKNLQAGNGIIRL